MFARKTASSTGYKSILLSAIVAALAAPIAVQAADAGPKTREDVNKELNDAHKAGTHDMGGQASPVQLKPAGSSASASRQQVKKDLEKAHKEGTHDMGGDLSTVKQPATKSKVSREQVKKDLERAHKAGTHDMGGEASPAQKP